MSDNPNLGIKISDEPADLIGQRISLQQGEFEIASIYNTGMEKIVYNLKDIHSEEVTHVLRLYRARYSYAEFEDMKAKHNLFKGALKDAVLDSEFLFLDGRVLEVQIHLAPPGSGNLLISTHSLFAYSEPLSRDAVDKARIMKLYSEEHFEEALQESDAKLEASPLNVDYLSIRAGCLLSLDRADEAAETLELCIEMEPDNARHYVNLAMTESHRGYLGYASALAAKAAEIAPEHPLVWERLFEFELELGHVYAARRCFEQLRRLAPKSSYISTMEGQLEKLSVQVDRANQNMRQAWQRYRQDHVDEALQLAKSVQETAPFNLDARMLIGAIALDNGRWPEAISAFGEIVSLDISNVDATFLWGYAFLMDGQVDRASSIHTIWVTNVSNSLSRFQQLLEQSPGQEEQPIEISEQAVWNLVQNFEQTRERCVGVRAKYTACIKDQPVKNTDLAPLLGGIDDLLGSMKELGITFSSGEGPGDAI